MHSNRWSNAQGCVYVCHSKSKLGQEQIASTDAQWSSTWDLDENAENGLFDMIMSINDMYNKNSALSHECSSALKKNFTQESIRRPMGLLTTCKHLHKTFRKRAKTIEQDQ